MKHGIIELKLYSIYFIKNVRATERSLLTVIIAHAYSVTV
jgi:hypothetical protein